MARVAVISDTHLPRGTRALPEECVRLLRGADLILHGGDFVTEDFLNELRALGPPVEAVYGNMDEPALKAALPHERVVEVGGARIGMIHIPARALAGRRGWRLASPIAKQSSTDTRTSRRSSGSSTCGSSIRARRPNAGPPRSTRCSSSPCAGAGSRPSSSASLDIEQAFAYDANVCSQRLSCF